MAQQVPSTAPTADSYVKLPLREQMLLRPDTYIGEVVTYTEPMWLPVEAEDGTVTSMRERDATYVPGLYKIFDEVLVNATDNKQRDPNMSMLKVDVDVEEAIITIYNNGMGIPVLMHPKEKCWVPELIFGHLLTSSNYNDSEKRTTGGRNGMGGKCANIFSTRFEITTCDGKKQFKMSWFDNMMRAGKPQVRDVADGTKSFTRVRFRPDLARFGMTRLDENDTLALMRRRVMDTSGTTTKSLQVKWNGKPAGPKTFKDYAKLFLGDTKFVHMDLGPRWEVIVASSDDGQFKQVSYVNNIATLRGGTHVDKVAKFVSAGMRDALQSKRSTADLSKLKPQHVRNHLFVLVNCLIENPSFDSQTKTTLKSREADFGSTFEITDAQIQALVRRTSVADAIFSWAEGRAAKDLTKTDGKKTGRVSGVDKLWDAAYAGTKRSGEATLILTEGDSAKEFAIAGLSVLGRERYGVFPLKGKPLNVRDASAKVVMNNEEIKNIKIILGLRQDETYDTESARKTLRYGSVMIMTDQDHDGSHIKGLIINLFSCFWPALLRAPGFLVEFITPIVKVMRGKGKNKQTRAFYTLPDYEKWLKTDEGQIKAWNAKYFKGLATSTSADAREYFSDLDRHRIRFKHEGEACDASIRLAFDKKMADHRKEWLSVERDDAEAGAATMDVDELSYDTFVNKELVLYSEASNRRGIPDMVDGLKPSQRKVIYTCLMLGDKELKVSQMAGIVSERSAYHHGEKSLNDTISNMAQDFVGSNNVNLMMPNGQFGTRLVGKCTSATRYIFTQITPVSKTLFRSEDASLLKHVNDDGQVVEPIRYLPVLPLAVINGCSGIGTGYSTYVPPHNPDDVMAAVLEVAEGRECPKISPWFRGWTGEVRTGTRPGYYVLCGRVDVASDGLTAIVSELPIGTWTDNFITMLKRYVESHNYIRDYNNSECTETEVRVKVTFFKPTTRDEVVNSLKLETKISTNNMHLFDTNGTIRKYDTVEDIISDWVRFRLVAYDARKEHLLKSMTRKQLILGNKAKFIRMFAGGMLPIGGKSRELIDRKLDSSGFDRIEGVYDYLLDMQFGALSAERAEKLNREVLDIGNTIDHVRASNSVSMMRNDLDEFCKARAAFEKQLAEEAEAREEECKNIRKRKTPSAGSSHPRKRQKKRQ